MLHILDGGIGMVCIVLNDVITKREIAAIQVINVEAYYCKSGIDSFLRYILIT